MEAFHAPRSGPEVKDGRMEIELEWSFVWKVKSYASTGVTLTPPKTKPIIFLRFFWRKLVQSILDKD